MKVQVLEEATYDLADGYRFYEKQAEGGAITFWIRSGLTFILCACTAAFMSYICGYHRLLSKRFPFAVYYRIEYGVTRVRAVLEALGDVPMLYSLQQLVIYAGRIAPEFLRANRSARGISPKLLITVLLCHNSFIKSYLYTYVPNISIDGIFQRQFYFHKSSPFWFFG